MQNLRNLIGGYHFLKYKITWYNIFSDLVFFFFFFSRRQRNLTWFLVNQHLFFNEVQNPITYSMDRSLWPTKPLTPFREKSYSMIMLLFHEKKKKNSLSKYFKCTPLTALKTHPNMYTLLSLLSYLRSFVQQNQCHVRSACDITVFYREEPWHVSLWLYILQRRTMACQLVALLCSTEKNHGMSACDIVF